MLAKKFDFLIIANVSYKEYDDNTDHTLFELSFEIRIVVKEREWKKSSDNTYYNIAQHFKVLSLS